MAGGICDYEPSGTTSEIFLLDRQEWVEGPRLPREFGVGGHVNPDKSTLILAGGFNEARGSGYSDIMVLDSSQAKTIGDLKFTSSEAELQTPRFLFALALVHDNDQC